MTIINQSKPSTSLTNADKPSLGETWTSITSTWASETRTWAETSGLMVASSKVAASITNATKIS